MNRTYEVDIQTMKDSAYYSNQQLAYIKKGKTVKFYNYKGRLKKELDLESRIEKRYNPTGEQITINSGTNYMFDMGNGYYCYPDLLITPEGTIVKNGKESGMLATAYEVIDTIAKNNLGYPAAIKLNETGQITEIANEKREYDDLGRILKRKRRILKRKIYSGSDYKPYISIEYIYENNNLKTSKHTGTNEPDNFTKEYTFDTKGQLFKVKQLHKDSLQIISFYHFSEDLLKAKKIYTQHEKSISAELIAYTYGATKHCINEKYFLYNAEETFTMKEIENVVDVAVNKEYPYKNISTDYVFKDDSFIGLKETNLRTNPTPQVVKEYIYNCNTNKQLSEVVDDKGKVIIEFFYTN